MKSLLAAFAFLTRLPVGKSMQLSAGDVGRAGAWFPLVGLTLGACYAGVAKLLSNHLAPLVISVLLVALDAAATGALHLDGLADSADGFGGGRTRDDVLRIMRDHAIGTYGGVALSLLIVFKIAAYQILVSDPMRLAAIVIVPALGRWSILLLTAVLPYARSSASPASTMRGIPTIIGTAITVATTAALQSITPWIALIACIVVSAALGWYCRRRIGGITGDTLGANLQLCESAALLVFIWRP